MTRVAPFLAAVAVAATACFGAETDVTASGKGLPRVELDFPLRTRAGSVATATFTVSNPGPGDMQGVAITFARVGNSYPIVDAGSRRRNPAVAGIDPAPRGIDSTGVVYRFGGLGAGDSAAYEFRLIVPDRRGPAANSVTVSAAEDLERMRGLRLETVVE